MGQAGLAKVHLVVDHARHKKAPARINNLGALVGVDRRGDLLDTIADDKHIGVPDLAFIDQA